MKRIIEKLAETCGEGLIYDVVCHAFAALVAWHVVTGHTAEAVKAFASHLDSVAPTVETATVTPPSIFHAHHRKEAN